MSRFGPQPARVLLRRRGYSIAGLAEWLGVPERHFRNALGGHSRPCPAILSKLPLLVGLPVEELFSPSSLEKDYDPTKNPWRGIA